MFLVHDDTPATNFSIRVMQPRSTATRLDSSGSVMNCILAAGVFISNVRNITAAFRVMRPWFDRLVAIATDVSFRIIGLFAAAEEKYRVGSVNDRVHATRLFRRIAGQTAAALPSVVSIAFG